MKSVKHPPLEVKPTRARRRSSTAAVVAVAGTGSGKMVSSVCVRNTELRVVEFVCDVLLLMRLQKIPRLPRKKSGKRPDAGGDDDGGDRVGVVGEEVKVQKEAPSFVLFSCHCHIAMVA